MFDELTFPFSKGSTISNDLHGSSKFGPYPRTLQLVARQSSPDTRPSSPTPFEAQRSPHVPSPDHLSPAAPSPVQPTSLPTDNRGPVWTHPMVTQT